jgi:Mg-chelatase subunit ChlD
VLDTSASLRGARLTNLIDAGRELTRALEVGERAALLTFSQVATVRTPMTLEMSTLRDALSVLKGSGATALRDAVYLAIATAPTVEARRLVLLFSDGVDTASWLTEDDVLETVRRANIVVHVVRFGSDGFVERLAEVSGGRAWSATSDRDLQRLFTGALEEMRARYVLTYRPQGAVTSGWHDVQFRPPSAPRLD